MILYVATLGEPFWRIKSELSELPEREREREAKMSKKSLLKKSPEFEIQLSLKLLIQCAAQIKKNFLIEKIKLRAL